MFAAFRSCGVVRHRAVIGRADLPDLSDRAKCKLVKNSADAKRIRHTGNSRVLLPFAVVRRKTRRTNRESPKPAYRGIMTINKAPGGRRGEEEGERRRTGRGEKEKNRKRERANGRTNEADRNARERERERERERGGEEKRESERTNERLIETSVEQL